MAKLAKKNTDAIKSGQWIDVLYDGDVIQVQTAGQTDDFVNAQRIAHKKAAEPFQGDVSRVPVQVLRPINCRLLQKHAFKDISGLYHDEAETQPVTAEDIKAILLDPEAIKDHAELIDALFTAQRLVEDGKGRDLQEAEGN